MLFAIPAVIGAAEFVWENRAAIGAGISTAAALIGDLKAIHETGAGKIAERDLMKLFASHKVSKEDQEAIMNAVRTNADVAKELEDEADRGGGAL